MRPIYLLTIILYHSSTLLAQYIGTTCILDSGLNGVCELIANCPAAVELIQDRKRPQLCEFISEEPIVCCPRDRIVKNEKSKFKFQRRGCSILNNTPFRFNALKTMTEDRIFKIADAPLHVPMKRATQDVEDTLRTSIHNIAGGERARKAEFPHMVRLGIGENETNVEWYCGGSLISDKFILTAAHCIYSRFGTINWALLGEPSAKFLQERVQITNNIIHPNFNHTAHYHDIALSEMKNKIYFGINIQPACVYIEREIPKGVPITVTGWGSTEFASEASTDLLKADLSLFSYQECSQKYTKSIRKLPRGIDDETQICAGGRTEVKDTCQGDSGGPIQIKVTNTNYDQIYFIFGITSFGKICGYINQPGVYVRLYPYLGWIENIIFNSTIV